MLKIETIEELEKIIDKNSKDNKLIEKRIEKKINNEKFNDKINKLNLDVSKIIDLLMKGEEGQIENIKNLKGKYKKILLPSGELDNFKNDNGGVVCQTININNNKVPVLAFNLKYEGSLNNKSYFEIIENLNNLFNSIQLIDNGKNYVDISQKIAICFVRDPGYRATIKKPENFDGEIVLVWVKEVNKVPENINTPWNINNFSSKAVFVSYYFSNKILNENIVDEIESIILSEL